MILSQIMGTKPKDLIRDVQLRTSSSATRRNNTVVEENGTHARVNDPRNSALFALGFRAKLFAARGRTHGDSSSRSFCRLNEKGQAQRERARA